MKLLSPFLSPMKKRAAARDAERILPTKATSCCSVDITVSSDEESSSSDGVVNRVRFCVDEARQYESPWIIVKDASQVDGAERDSIKIAVVQPNLWYHKTDIGRFKSNVQVSARVLQTREKADTTSWFCDTMWNAFLKFRQVDTCNAMNSLMNTATDLNIEPEHVGLEAWLQNSSAMRSQARKRMYGDVMHAQADHASDKQLRKICREHSRGSRLYAHFIGRAMAST
eukprot:scaffold34709_cov189-Amphora_coffeaeformis.AAC.2